MLESLRSNIRAMSGYTPGEQPRDGSSHQAQHQRISLSAVAARLRALCEALTGDRLRKYPDPVGTVFRQTASRILNVDPDGILIGNGSDDILTILTRAFVPEGGLIASPTPSYLLYRTVAELQGSRIQMVPFNVDWSAAVAVADRQRPSDVPRQSQFAVGNRHSAPPARRTAVTAARPAGHRRSLRRLRRRQRPRRRAFAERRRPGDRDALAEQIVCAGRASASASP